VLYEFSIMITKQFDNKPPDILAPFS